jgi:hypothetical protein
MHLSAAAVESSRRLSSPSYRPALSSKGGEQPSSISLLTPQNHVGWLKGPTSSSTCLRLLSPTRSVPLPGNSSRLATRRSTPSPRRPHRRPQHVSGGSLGGGPRQGPRRCTPRRPHHRTSTHNEPQPRRRRDGERRPQQDRRAALRLVILPEPFEIGAHGLDAEPDARRDGVRPRNCEL